MRKCFLGVASSGAVAARGFKFVPFCSLINLNHTGRFVLFDRDSPALPVSVYDFWSVSHSFLSESNGLGAWSRSREGASKIAGVCSVLWRE